MRMMLKVQCDVEASNEAIKDGSLGRLIERTMEDLKPEAAYFGTQGGLRTAFIVFDLKDPSQIPMIAEPWFMLVKAKVDFMPVMDAKDLKAGLEQAAHRRPAMV